MLVKLNKGKGKAQSIDKLKKIVGYLLGVQWTKATGSGKNKRKPSPIYRLEDSKGEVTEVWGCASINQQLLATPDKPGSPLDDALQGCLVSLRFLGLVKVNGRAQKMKDVEVLADVSNRVKVPAKRGKPYQLKQ